MIIDQVIWAIVEKIALVDREIRDLLQMRAINNKQHAAQPKINSDNVE